MKITHTLDAAISYSAFALIVNNRWSSDKVRTYIELMTD